ncbi:MAG: Ldh family oxidoreductase [Candidatus Omnitrophota bacterium]
MLELVRVKTNELEEFAKNVFMKLGMNEEEAWISADVLVAADKRGIESHGVARLQRYVDDIKRGLIRLDTEMKIVVETPVSMVIDGDAGIGQVIGYRIMKRCIEKAKTNFMCMAAIRNSNHYGIAGYYTAMALKEKMIGLSFTNSAPLVVPTFGKDAVLGTNPISVGVPAKEERPFLLDMATSTVPRGKVEVYARKGQTMPTTWATDEKGEAAEDAQLVLNNLINRRGGGLLPLGGAGKLNSGHKGYDLAALVDILCGVFSGGEMGTDVYGKKGEPAGVAHFLGVINPAAFIGPDAMGEKLDYFIRMLKNSQKAEGQDRIYVAGEMEYEAEEAHAQSLPLLKKVFDNLNNIGKEFNLTLNGEPAGL